MTARARKPPKSLGWPRYRILVAAILVLGLVTAYFPGLWGPFVFDDHENITTNTPVALHTLTLDTLADALLANDSGPFGRPLASISFALNHYLAGGFDHTFWFKATNLAIHAANTWLVYALLLAMTATPRLNSVVPKFRQRAVAGIAAAGWALHPIHVTSVLYVVQRMTSLAATFVLAGALLYLKGRTRLAKGDPRGAWIIALGLSFAVLLGVAAKETAALLPLLALVVEFALFGRQDLDARVKRRLAISLGIAFAVPITLFLLYFLPHPTAIVDGYAVRDFSLSQRLYTEARVLWMYVWLLLVPIPSHFSLFHDNFTISIGLFDPLTTAPAVLALLAVCAYALYRPQRHTALKLAILWFLAGHALESSIFGLELAHEHRNYLPSIGFFFALAVGVSVLLDQYTWRPRTVALCAVAFLITLAFSTWVRAGAWSDVTTLAYTTVHDHPDSPRANDFAARVSLHDRNDMVTALRYTLRGLALRPLDPAFHIDLHLLLAVLSEDLEGALGDSGKTDVPPAPTEVAIPGLDQPLFLTYTREGAKLSHLASDTAAVARLLEESRISVHAVISLENLARCVLQPPKSCSAIQQTAAEWHEIAVRNPRTPAMYRGLVAASAARLAAGEGKIELALDYMNRAVGLVPGQLSFRLGTLDYLLQLGRIGPADSVLEAIHNTSWPRADWAANKEALERLERRRASAPKNASTVGNVDRGTPVKPQLLSTQELHRLLNEN